MLGRQRPFSPSVPAEAGCLFNCCGRCSCVFISVESLHCFLVGWCTNKSYVIATSDLWLFIHASNLLPLNSPSPLPYSHIPRFLFSKLNEFYRTTKRNVQCNQFHRCQIYSFCFQIFKFCVVPRTKQRCDCIHHLGGYSKRAVKSYSISATMTTAQLVCSRAI